MVDLHVVTRGGAALERHPPARVGLGQRAREDDAVAGAGLEGLAGQVAGEDVVAGVAAVVVGVDPAVAEQVAVVAGGGRAALHRHGGERGQRGGARRPVDRPLRGLVGEQAGNRVDAGRRALLGLQLGERRLGGGDLGLRRRRRRGGGARRRGRRRRGGVVGGRIGRRRGQRPAGQEDGEPAGDDRPADAPRGDVRPRRRTPDERDRADGDDRQPAHDQRCTGAAGDRAEHDQQQDDAGGGQQRGGAGSRRGRGDPGRCGRRWQGAAGRGVLRRSGVLPRRTGPAHGYRRSLGGGHRPGRRRRGVPRRGGVAPAGERLQYVDLDATEREVHVAGRRHRVRQRPGEGLQGLGGRGEPGAVQVEGDRGAVEDQPQVPGMAAAAGRDHPVAQLLGPLSGAAHQGVARPGLVVLQDLGDHRIEQRVPRFCGPRRPGLRNRRLPDRSGVWTTAAGTREYLNRHCRSPYGGRRTGTGRPWGSR
jgi:hypothetical protein